VVLPFKEIYTYHFSFTATCYSLLKVGQEGEFITQLEVEKQAKHTITHEIYNAVLPETAYKPMVIEKSESVMLRLKEIADIGFHHRR
jgi:hypothetical protein